jgi:cellulose synthase/poly-beta-1,6-N-acetylglucosamine synthase-like glycosyltransferase
MATGFEIHRHKNPATGKKWRSVYTPDVLAVGEGPSAWTDFFTQQMRWSRGTYETILKQYWKGWFSLPPSKLFNYTMMIIFYPMSALNWILAALSCALFLGLGASGVNIDPTIWLMLYGNASALQIGLYVWNRRHNVSPHEPEGSGGVAGMVMSALSAPLYAKALIDSVLRRKSKFVVTPKGDSASPDRWFGTFRYHWYFILIFGASMAAGFYFGNSHPAMIIWASFAMLITATPIFAWRWQMRQEKKKRATAPEPGAAESPEPLAPGTAAPHGPHAPQQKPSWAAADRAPGPDRQAAGPDQPEAPDQTMQIALGGRKK